MNMVNEMLRHSSGNDELDHDYFTKVIPEVAKFIKNHFASEEKIMFATQFYGYDEHKTMHDNFLFAIVENIRENRFTLSSFIQFVRDWALHHIVSMDKQYFDYCTKKNHPQYK